MGSFQSILTGLFIMINIVGNSSNERLLFIFGKGENEILVQQQVRLLDSVREEIKERSLTITVVPESSALIGKYQVKRGEFVVILVGKDGTEKYRTNNLLQPARLFAIIDAMPMRKEEIRKKKAE